MLRWLVVLLVFASVGVAHAQGTEYCEGMARASDSAPCPPRFVMTRHTLDQIQSTYVLVYGLVAYELKLPRLNELGGAPTVEFVSPEVLCQRMYRTAAPFRCAALAGHRDGQIWASDEQDYRSPRGMAVIAHEFVHWFEDRASGRAKTCHEQFTRERRAYRVQAELLDKMGVETQQDTINGLRGAMNQMRLCLGKYGTDEIGDSD